MAPLADIVFAFFSNLADIAITAANIVTTLASERYRSCSWLYEASRNVLKIFQGVASP